MQYKRRINDSSSSSSFAQNEFFFLILFVHFGNHRFRIHEFVSLLHFHCFQWFCSSTHTHTYTCFNGMYWMRWSNKNHTKRTSATLINSSYMRNKRASKWEMHPNQSWNEKKKLEKLRRNTWQNEEKCDRHVFYFRISSKKIISLDLFYGESFLFVVLFICLHVSPVCLT